MAYWCVFTKCTQPKLKIYEHDTGRQRNGMPVPIDSATNEATPASSNQKCHLTMMNEREAVLLPLWPLFKAEDTPERLLKLRCQRPTCLFLQLPFDNEKCFAPSSSLSSMRHIAHSGPERCVELKQRTVCEDCQLRSSCTVTRAHIAILLRIPFLGTSEIRS